MTLLLRCAVAVLFATPLFGQFRILTSSLPPAAVGKFYQAGFSVLGGTAPFFWSATSSIPPGLSLNIGGSITGTPLAIGSYTFTLLVSDSLGGKASRDFTLVVGAAALSINSANLPPATAGKSFSVQLTATGGASPYRWAASAGLPAGFTLDAQTGVLSGTPSASGTFGFSVQVTDTAQAVASANFSLVVNAAPLEITTLPPLFPGTVGVGYSQLFAASGGTSPYAWSISSGSAGVLTLDPSTGTLRGTPDTAGTFVFTVQVADAAGATASKSFSLVVSPPVLSIVVSAALPPGTAGAPYSQKVPVTAVGGTPPYAWSVAGPVAPGLDFSPDTLTISGTPSAPGTFTFSLQAADAARQTAARTLTIAIAPSQLAITTARQFPDGALNAPYSASLFATGGAPPYTWSAAGLPDGLHIDANTGVISGAPAAAGTFPVAITLGDAALSRVSDRFTLTIKLPSPPPILLSGLPGVAEAAGQYAIQVALGSGFPAPIAGQAILTFAPDSGPTDRTIQFASGGTIANFSIPAGATVAISDVPLAIQTGTVSGTISISVRLQAGGIDITPLPAPSLTTQVARGAPVISDVRLSRSEGKLSLIVSGFSTAREVTQATVAFAAANGQTLQAGASSFTIPVETLFSAWFQDPANGSYGSQFVFTQPFTVQGDSGAVLPQTVTLTNRVGSTTYRIP